MTRPDHDRLRRAALLALLAVAAATIALLAVLAAAVPRIEPDLDREVDTARTVAVRADRADRAVVPDGYDYEGEQHALRHVAELREAERARAAAPAPPSAPPTPTPIPAPPPAAPAAPAPPPAPTGDVWWRLALCESGGNPATNTGNGYYGAFQFLPATWRSVGGTGLPHQHSYEEQRHRAQLLQARSGWGQWPACSRKLGLR